MQGSWISRHSLTALLSGAVLFAASCGKTTAQQKEPLTSQNGPPCFAPLLECHGLCADIGSDAANCGSCGASCPAGDACAEGVCKSTGCPAGRQDCGGLCVDSNTNPLNCGACNSACTPPETCVGGACECAAPAELCNGVCKDLSTSSSDCGGCGNACAADQSCVDGACQARCASPTTYCGDRCANLATDSKACGDCQTACPTNEFCAGGKCQCPIDFSDCGGACTDVNGDAQNCGSCGNACPNGTRCEGGVCTACRDGFFYCPSQSGDPLQTCLGQARTPPPSSDAGDLSDVAPVPMPQPLSPNLECQCTHCLVELQDCVDDPQCPATWQCAMQNACTVPCWGMMGVCATSASTVGCFKFCPPSTGSTQTAARAEALLRCTVDNGCGI